MGQRLVDIGGDALVNLADETQRQVKIARIDPFRAADAGFQQRQMKLQFRREFDADKETQHFLPSASLRAKRSNLLATRDSFGGGLLRRSAPRNDSVVVVWSLWFR